MTTDFQSIVGRVVRAYIDLQEKLMTTASTCWNLVVSKETDESVRQFLASEDGGRNRDLSLFVEDAVRKQIFETTLRAIREKNADVDPEFLDQAVDEALAWARQS